MESLDEILLEEEKERSANLEFYQSNNDVLLRVFLREIPFPVLHRMAVILHGTMEKEVEWMDFLYDLGIKDDVLLTWIKQRAKSCDGLAIYEALRGPLQHKKSFGALINVLITKEKYRVLYDIKPFVEDLLNKKTSELQPSWYSNCIHPTAPSWDGGITDEKLAHNTDSVDCKSVNNELQCSEFNNSVYPKETLTEGCRDSENLKRKLVITVLLLHSLVDTVIAKNLSSLLKNAGIVVRMLSDMDYLLLMNSEDTIHALLSTVDFVIPVLSESFLRDIHPSGSLPLQQNNPSSEEDNLENSAHNHYIYHLLLDEFIKNKCLNFRVRPVRVSNINRNSVKFDLLLRCPLKLWDQAPKLIEILRKTKLLLRSDL